MDLVPARHTGQGDLHHPALPAEFTLEAYATSTLNMLPSSEARAPHRSSMTSPLLTTMAFTFSAIRFLRSCTLWENLSGLPCLWAANNYSDKISARLAISPMLRTCIAGGH